MAEAVVGVVPHVVDALAEAIVPSANVLADGAIEPACVSAIADDAVSPANPGPESAATATALRRLTTVASIATAEPGSAASIRSVEANRCPDLAFPCPAPPPADESALAPPRSTA
jgi:hypothetical protein